MVKPVFTGSIDHLDDFDNQLLYTFRPFYLLFVVTLSLLFLNTN